MPRFSLEHQPLRGFIKKILMLIALPMLLSCAIENDADSDVRKRVFVTSSSFDGNLRVAGNGLNGLSGADNLCRFAAENGGLEGGFWVAWLSDASVNAINRIQPTGPWYLVNRETLVFNNKAEMETQPLVAISLDEFSNPIEPGSPSTAWTGTIPGGLSSGQDCDSWEEASCEAQGSGSPVMGTVGEATSVEGWTTAVGMVEIDENRRLYCIEQ